MTPPVIPPVTQTINPTPPKTSKTGGQIIPPGTKHLDAKTYCRGLTGTKLDACYEEVADFNDLHNTSTKVQTRQAAGKATIPVGISAGAGGQVVDTTHAQTGASSQTTSGEARTIVVRNDTPEGRLWSLFLKWAEQEYKIHGLPIAQQILALNAAIAKLEEENTLANRLGNFFSNPFAVISTAIAAYATSGVAAGAVLGKIFMGDDSIDAKIAKARKYRDELQVKVNRVPNRAKFELLAPAKATRIISKQDNRLGLPPRSQEGSDPLPREYLAFLDDMS